MEKEDDKCCLFKIERPVYQIHEIDEAVKRSNNNICQEPFEEIVHGTGCCHINVKDTLESRIPSLVWLWRYNWKKDFAKDAIAGFTVAIMNIPQGMGYAMLANVPPVVGIYMAFFPVIVYAFLGTSRHISMGSFAVVCLMVGKVVMENVGNHTEDTNLIHNNTSVEEATVDYTPIEIATAVSFAVGVFQIIMCICRLDIICALLSETLVSGFTAGAAIHVLTSQIKDMFGFRVPSYSGTFQIIYTYIAIFRSIGTINLAATAISAITVVILVSNNELLKPWLKKKTAIPLPIELIVVLIGTVASRYYGIAGDYNLKIVGHISVGLPDPRPPPFPLIPNIALQSLVIAIVAYVVSVSMAMIFAQQLKYEINPNQELLAQGAGNIVGSFFSCSPFAASLSRSVIQQTVGGRTQLASLISSSLLLVVLLCIGPFFEPLPCCILSSLIVVALKGILFKVKELPQIWRLSVLDGIVWIVTYLTVILIEIDVGLFVGLVVSFISLFIQGMKPHTCLLGRVPGTDIYVDRSKYCQTLQPTGVKIIHYAGGLNFANRGYFKNEVYKLLQIRPNELFASQQASKLGKQKTTNSSSLEKVRYIILDLSGFHYVDPSGASSLLDMAKEFSSIGIVMYGAGTSEPVYESFRANGLLESNLFTLFPTIHDAVLYAQHKLSRISNVS